MLLEVLAEMGKLFLHVVDIFLPVLDSFKADSGPSSNGSSSIGPSVLLQRPGQFSLEVEHLERESRVRVHQIVAEVYTWVCDHFLVSAGNVAVEAVNVQVLHPVAERVFADLWLSVDGIVEAE